MATAQWGKALWGQAEWGAISSPSQPGAIFQGQGVLTGGPSFTIGASFPGQGILTGSGAVLVFGSGTFPAQGIFFEFTSGTRDASTIKFYARKGQPFVKMPVASVTKIYQDQTGAVRESTFTPLSGNSSFPRNN